MDLWAQRGADTLAVVDLWALRSEVGKESKAWGSHIPVVWVEEEVSTVAWVGLLASEVEYNVA